MNLLAVIMAKRDAKPDSRFLTVTVIFTAMFSVFIIFLDIMEARFHNSTFYFSESLLFSSFWWLILPLLYLQLVSAPNCKSNAATAVLFVLPIAVHLFAFPALVWLLSSLYYYHTFSFLQTLKYALTEHLITIILVYTLPVSISLIYISRSKKAAASEEPVIIVDPVSSFEVMKGKKRINIATNDISFFSANPPYTNIHHGETKYLSNETLKSLSAKIDNTIFVQIHKSFIVNVLHVKYYQSRHNGDYDLVTYDDTVLRVSRNYARGFKTKFADRPQHTA